MSILLSIKPEFSKKIFSGEKKFEFRRQKPKKDTKFVIVYESSPSKCIVGYFFVEMIHSGSPEEIWKECKNYGGIEEDKFFLYCRGKKVIHALEIGETFKLDKPVDPYGIDSYFTPPQNFYYINNSIALKSWKECTVVENVRV